MNLGPAELLIVTSSSTSDKARGKFRTFKHLMDVKPFLFRLNSLAIKTLWVGWMMAESCNNMYIFCYIWKRFGPHKLWDCAWIQNNVLKCIVWWRTIMLDNPVSACQKNCKNGPFKISNCKNHTCLPNHHWQNVHNQYKQNISQSIYVTLLESLQRIKLNL